MQKSHPKLAESRDQQAHIEMLRKAATSLAAKASTPIVPATPSPLHALMKAEGLAGWDMAWKKGMHPWDLGEYADRA